VLYVLVRLFGFVWFLNTVSPFAISICGLVSLLFCLASIHTSKCEPVMMLADSALFRRCKRAHSHDCLSFASHRTHTHVWAKTDLHIPASVPMNMCHMCSSADTSHPHSLPRPVIHHRHFNLVFQLGVTSPPKQLSPPCILAVTALIK
jgi:hypothetical protein